MGVIVLGGSYPSNRRGLSYGVVALGVVLPRVDGLGVVVPGGSWPVTL